MKTIQNSSKTNLLKKKQILTLDFSFGPKLARRPARGPRFSFIRPWEKWPKLIRAQCRGPAVKQAGQTGPFRRGPAASATCGPERLKQRTRTRPTPCPGRNLGLGRDSPAPPGPNSACSIWTVKRRSASSNGSALRAEAQKPPLPPAPLTLGFTSPSLFSLKHNRRLWWSSVTARVRPRRSPS
jgi:hypothetical protein